MATSYDLYRHICVVHLVDMSIFSTPVSDVGGFQRTLLDLFHCIFMMKTPKKSLRNTVATLLECLKKNALS